MTVKENVTSFGAAAGIILSMLNIPTYFSVPHQAPSGPGQVTAPDAAAISFDRPTISSTPAPVEPVAEPQSDATTPTNPESTPTASPVVEPAQAPAAKKTTSTVTAPVQGAVQGVPGAVQGAVQDVQGAVGGAVNTATGLGSKIASAAYSQLGVTQDCTMLVTNSLAAVGIHFHGWPAGYLALGHTVPASQAQPGDLAYYVNGGMGVAHIAVYIGNGQAIHGGWNGNTTAIASVNVGSGPIFIRVDG